MLNLQLLKSLLTAQSFTIPNNISSDHSLENLLSSQSLLPQSGISKHTWPKLNGFCPKLDCLTGVVAIIANI